MLATELQMLNKSNTQIGGTASCKRLEGGNFGVKLTHPCGFWLDVLFFSHMRKHRSRFWLARTHVRLKIYDIAFSEYISVCIQWKNENKCPTLRTSKNHVSLKGSLWILCAFKQNASRFRQSNKSVVFLARSTCRRRNFSWICYYSDSACCSLPPQQLQMIFILIKSTLLVVNFMC